MISVIIPVYNGAKGLKKCVNSILMQSLSSFELILSDDGSYDNSSHICDEYAILDERIVVVHKLNGGAAEARNYALDFATGDLISFIDCDDYIDHNMYEIMSQTIINTNTDVCICAVESVDEFGNHLDCTPRFTKKIVDSPELWAMYFKEKRGGFISPCNKVFRCSVWRALRFPAGKRYEDEFVFQRIIDNSKQISMINEPFYKYFVNADSTTHTQRGIHALDYCECQFERANIFFTSNQKFFASQSVLLGILALIDANVYFEFNDLNEKNKNKEMMILATKMAKKASIKGLTVKNKLQILISRYSLKILFVPYTIVKTVERLRKKDWISY